MIHYLRITPSATSNMCLLTTHHQSIPFPTPLPSEGLNLFSRVHSLAWFIPPSVYLPFILPFLLLPIFLLFLMFHKWVKPYDNCLCLLDLFHLAYSFSFLHLFLLRNTSLEDREQACLPLTIKTVVSPGSMFLSWNILNLQVDTWNLHISAMGLRAKRINCIPLYIRTTSS